MSEKLKDAFAMMFKDRVMAHAILFQHRHPHKTPPFHIQMIEDFHFGPRHQAVIGFRGCAKSTLMEEGVIIKALFREFRNCKLFGETLDMAKQRLHAIKRELEKNERIKNIFGDVRSNPWADDKIELASGVVIEAFGRGQSMRGTKEEIVRPDFIVFDDVESLESVRTPEAREKVKQWFYSDVLQAGDIDATVRMLANDLHPECLANELKKPGSGFQVKVYPVLFRNSSGEIEATWPDRMPLAKIREIETTFETVGRRAEFNREYLCRSELPESKPFRPEMIRVEAVVRTWHAVYGFYDPARTVRQTSARTGFASWSYIANRIVVWDAWGRRILPDEIVADLFRFNEEMAPAEIGIEEDGLNEFLMQPIRQESLKRGIVLPVRAMKAPRGKIDFIRGLQPFFNAREIVFARDLQDLRNELMTFPTGLIDIANALAYALKMRPGAPVYDDFRGTNVQEDLAVQAGRDAWLALNTNGSIVTAALVQTVDGQMRVLADWVREGEPGTVLADILKEANMEAKRKLRLIAGNAHFQHYTNYGLRQTVARLGMELEKGGEPLAGRQEIRDLLKREVKGLPAFLLAGPHARWTANGMAGGYAREVKLGGGLQDFAVDNHYRVLLEGLETFASLLRLREREETDDGVRYDTTTDGRRFISARR